MTSTLERFMSKVEMITESGCWIWMGATRYNGYGAFKYKDKMDGSHRVSWELFKGVIPKGLNVLHRCDIPCCVNPDHLFLGTQQDNMDDMMIKNRFPSQKGINNGNAKLTEVQIKEILSLHRSERFLAKQYGVHKSTIHRIKS